MIVSAIWVGLGLLSLFNGRSSALDGLNRLEAIRDGFEIEQLESGELTAELTVASGEFARAQSNLRAPWLAPFRLVPWVGTQIRSADALSSSAATVSKSLANASTAAVAIRDNAQAQTINKAEASERLLALTTVTREELAPLHLGPASGLTGGLSDARSRFERELAELDDTLADAQTAMAGITEFLSGPTTYLLLSANTSEMRVGSGRFLSAGLIEIRNGEVGVGDLIEPAELLLPADAVPVTDLDFAASWSQLEPTTDLRNLASTPRFEVTASLAADMWEAAAGRRVDGVLAIDPVTLQRVLDVGDGVSVDGFTVDGSNVIAHVMLNQYWEDDKPTRRARQQELASVALSAAVGSELNLIDLASALESAAAGRHILAWSHSAVQQATWELLGVDGRLEPDSLMISLLNDGFNKLDTFIELDSSASSSQVVGGTAIEILLDVRNQAGPHLPDYVLGPFEWAGLELGSYRGILVVNLPAAAEEVSLQGPGQEVAAGSDGPTQMVALNTRIDSGEVARYVVRFTLPNGSERLTVEPSARVPAAHWSLDGQRWYDVAARTIDFETGDYGSQPSDSPPEIEPSTEPTIPPTPSVRLEDDGESVAVSWRVLPTNAEIVMWERNGSDDWRVLASPLPSFGQLTLPVGPSTGFHCFRTSLTPTTTTFSSSSCVEGGEPAASG